MKSDFSHGRKGFRIQINGLGLIYIKYLIICFIIDVITYPKTFSTKFSTNPGGVLQSGLSWAVTSAAAAVHAAWTNFCPMRRFDGWADPETYVVMKRKTCFFPGWVGCINILMVSQFYPHFPARLRLHRGACPQSMREWLCCPHAGCNILDRYKVVPVDHKSLPKPVLFWYHR